MAKDEPNGAARSRAGHPVLTASRPELLRDGTDTEFRQLVHNLLAFSAKLQEVRGAFGAYLGLSGIQYTILISVAHLDGEHGVGVKRVAAHLNLSGAFVTIETNKLAQMGLLAKRGNPHDRRRVLLTVTDAGLAALAKLAPIQRPVNDALFAELSVDDFDRLLALSSRLLIGAQEAASLVAHLTASEERRMRS
jgi:DNA-binding MarR family transcriptional regulator